MEHHVYRRWQPPLDTRIEDFHGWLEDLHSARDFFERMNREVERADADPVIIDALCVAALVRYSRVFTTGIRARLSIEQLTTAADTDRSTHERLRGIRDWHVAHPVNEQEVHALYVIVDTTPGAETGALGFSSLSNADLALLPPDAAAAILLCNKWIDFLTPQFVREQQLLLPVVRSLSREELLALPADEPEPNPNVRSKRRQRPK